MGYFFTIIGGLLGIFIGYSLFTVKKTLPNGKKVYSYSENDRKHGHQPPQAQPSPARIHPPRSTLRRIPRLHGQIQTTCPCRPPQRTQDGRVGPTANRQSTR